MSEPAWTNTPSRVLFATAYYPPFAPGGSEHSAEALANGLRDRDVEVYVATPQYGGRASAPHVHSIPVGVRPDHHGEALRPRIWLRPDVQLRLAWGFWSVARQRHVQLIHCQNMVAVPAAYVAARALGIPLVVTLRDLDAVCPLAVCLLTHERVPDYCGVRSVAGRCATAYGRRYKITRTPRLRASSVVGFLGARLRAALVARADAVVAVGRDILDLHRSAGLLGDAQAAIVTANIIDWSASPGSSATDSDALRNSDIATRPPLVVYAGNITVNKGVDTLVNAWPKFLAAAPEAKLVVAGRGDPQLTAALEALPSVDVRGFVPRSDLVALYKSARMAVVPSTWPEPLGRAVAEAQLLGVPVVASRVGGIVDAIDDATSGLLVKRNDPEALAKAMTRIWRDQTLAARLSTAGQAAAAARFSRRPVVERTMAAYRAALTGDGA